MKKLLWICEITCCRKWFFNIPKRVFEEKQECENTDSLGELLNKFYYKVPEKDVLKIEVKDEIVIV